MRLTVVLDQDHKHVVSAIEVSAVNFNDAWTLDPEQKETISVAAYAWDSGAMYIPVIVAGTSKIQYLEVLEGEVVKIGDSVAWPSKTHLVTVLSKPLPDVSVVI